MWAVTFVLIETRPVDWWSFTAGIIGASAGATLVFVRDDAPKHVLNWRRGAEGERKTEKALRPLENLGWLVEHDLQRTGGANVDHVVTGPPGVFVLETKNLEGTITIEDSVLTARQLDDPDQVYHEDSRPVCADRPRNCQRSAAQKRAAEPGFTLSS
jgi:hypothetical protein